MPNSNFMSDANATAIFTAYATAIKLGLKAWVGTTAEWDQLTDAQKKQYQVNFKTDDCSGESIEAVKKSIADDFSANVNYAVGDFCYHLGTLYKCTTAHSAGAWDATHFTATQVGDELSALNSTLTYTNYGTIDTLTVFSGTLCKVSNIAFLIISDFYSLANGETILTGKIPAGCRPPRSFVYTLIQRSNSDFRCIAVSVEANGNIIFYNYGSAISAATAFGETISWPIYW